MKLIFPDENIDKEDARMILEYAIEGRRRVKEQLKIMAGVEFMDVNLGYVDAENPADARIVFVAEQADETLIPEAPLQPGHVFAIGRSIGRVRRIQAGEQGGCGVVPLRERGRRFEPCRSRVHRGCMELLREQRRSRCGWYAHEEEGLPPLCERSAGEGTERRGQPSGVYRALLCRVQPPRRGLFGDSRHR